MYYLSELHDRRGERQLVEEWYVGTGWPHVLCTSQHLSDQGAELRVVQEEGARLGLVGPSLLHIRTQDVAQIELEDTLFDGTREDLGLRGRRGG